MNEVEKQIMHAIWQNLEIIRKVSGFSQTLYDALQQIEKEAEE